MAVNAQILRLGGMPANWATWGQANVSPGQQAIIGSGSGPFFTVVGVADGANFQFGRQLNIVLKVNGVASQSFQLPPNIYKPFEEGQYQALVSKIG
jgi:hypothetical protein